MLPRAFQINVKYAFDRLTALILSPILSPFLLMIAVAIKVNDRGAVFFRQERVGLNGRLFKVWKFRTMMTNADDLLDERGRVANINRLTRIGKILRLLSLDEIPQLINIAKGEMSFIGPRPVLPQHLSRYTEHQKKRLKMKPGITGLAQINGRNTLAWSKRIDFDIKYIENYSLLNDLKITLKTLRVVFVKDGVKLDRNPEEVDDLSNP